MASTELDITVTFNEGADVKTESERFNKLFDENGIIVDEVQYKEKSVTYKGHL